MAWATGRPTYLTLPRDSALSTVVRPRATTKLCSQVDGESSSAARQPEVSYRSGQSACPHVWSAKGQATVLFTVPAVRWSAAGLRLVHSVIRHHEPRRRIIIVIGILERTNYQSTCAHMLRLFIYTIHPCNNVSTHRSHRSLGGREGYATERRSRFEPANPHERGLED